MKSQIYNQESDDLQLRGFSKPGWRGRAEVSLEASCQTALSVYRRRDSLILVQHPMRRRSAAVIWELNLMLRTDKMVFHFQTSLHSSKQLCLFFRRLSHFFCLFPALEAGASKASLSLLPPTAHGVQEVLINPNYSGDLKRLFSVYCDGR